jgi:tetratricopeptide (TPR) repeat protein
VRGSDSALLKLLVQTLLNHSATLEKLGSPADSLHCKEKAYQALQDHVHDPEFCDLHLKCLIELSYHHAEHLGDKAKALELSRQALDLAQRLKDVSEAKYIKYYVATLVNTAIWVDNVDLAISYEQQALDIVGHLFKQNRALWVIHYATCLNNLAFSYEEKGRLAEVETIFVDVLSDVRSRYQEDKDRWTRAYAKSLTNIAQFYLNRQQFEVATAHFAEALEIVTIKYRTDPKDWADQYLKKTMNITNAYNAAGNFRKCVQMENAALALVERLREVEPKKWNEAYGFILNRAIETCRQTKKEQRQKRLQKKAKEITCHYEGWNAFYRKNPIVISTVFLNR